MNIVSGFTIRQYQFSQHTYVQQDEIAALNPTPTLLQYVKLIILQKFCPATEAATGRVL